MDIDARDIIALILALTVAGCMVVAVLKRKNDKSLEEIKEIVGIITAILTILATYLTGGD